MQKGVFLMKHRFSISLTIAMVLALVVTSLATAAVWTDKPDYSPGEVVTISGDNSDGAGFAAGETVNVDVSSPNGYSASCDAVADDFGAWSCQVTLAGDESAIGEYAYTATGQTSGVSQSGTFTDDKPHYVNFATSGLLSGVSITVTGNYTNTGSQPKAFSVTFTSPGPSSGAGRVEALPGTSFTYSGFPASLTVDSQTCNLKGTSPTSPFTTGAEGVTTTVTATYSCASVDTTPPAVTVPADITAEATGPSGAVVSFTATANDIVDGSVAVSCVPASGSTFAIATTTVNCSATDVAGNIGTGSFDVTVEDTTPPVGSITINSGATYTYSTSVTLNLVATDAVGVTRYRVADGTDASGGTVVAVTSTTSFSADISWTLPAGDGTKTVAVQYGDAAGNWSGNYTNSIVLDTTPPTTTIALNPASPDGSNDWYKTNVLVTVSASDAGGSGVAETRCVLDPASAPATFNDIPAGCAYTAPDVYVTTEGQHTVYAASKDIAGNKETPVSKSFKIDKTAPTGVSGTPNRTPDSNGWYNHAVDVIFAGTDATSGIASCTSTNYSGPDGSSLKVNGTCTDKAGNTSAPVASSAFDYDATAPINVSGAPNRAADHNGWYNHAVDVVFTGSDSPSDIDICTTVTYNSPDGSGITVNGTCTDKAGNTSSVVAFTFKYDATAPTISASVSPDRPASEWWNFSSGAPTVSFVCNDATSGLVGTCPADNTFGEGENQSYSQTIYDNAGNSASAGVSDIDVDLTTPSISAALNKLPAGTGWFNISTGVPTVEYTCSDSLSGIDICPADFTFGQGADQSHSGTAYDNAGNSASAGVINVDVDTVAPSISVLLDRATAPTGWFNTSTGAPTAVFTCSDGTSGIASCPASYLFGEGENQSHSGTALDIAGNSASASVSDIDVDLTAPSITWNGSINNGDSFYFGFVPAEPTCTATDALSGPNGCNVTGYGTSVDPHTMTATALDMAGNSYSETRFYTVLAWTPYGFYQPVDMGSVWNTVKNGSTVPLKFEIFAGTKELTDVLAVKSWKSLQVSCSTLPGAAEDAIDTLSATGSTVLRYDSTGGQFIFNWKTPNTPKICYQVTITAQDGSSITAFFKLK
jgi:hypothetical protein